MAVIVQPVFDFTHELAEAALCNNALSRIGAEVIRDTEEDSKQVRLCRALYAQTRDELLRYYPFNFSTKTAKIPVDDSFSNPLSGFIYAYKAEDYFTFTGNMVLGEYVITNIPIAMLLPDNTLIGRIVNGVGIRTDARIVSVNAQTIALDRPLTANGTTVTVTCHIAMLKFIGPVADDSTHKDIGWRGTRYILANVQTDAQTTRDGGYIVPANLEIRYTEQVINPALFDTIFYDAFCLRLAMKLAIPMSQDAGLLNKIQQEFAAIWTIAKIVSNEELDVDTAEPWWTDR